MAKTFVIMKANVGRICGISDSTFLTNAGVWINDAYQDAHKRFLWPSLVDDDYTFESVVDQSEYALPSDFEEEIFVGDIATAQRLKRFTEQSWWDARIDNYNADALTSGKPVRYVILYESSKIKLDPPPDKAETYAMPYKKTVTDMSADANTSAIRGLDLYLETYAISQGFAYKGEFQKADWYANKAEFELSKIIENVTNRSNQLDQWVGQGYNPQYDYGQTIGDNNYGI